MKYEHITLSYSTRVGQNEGIITLFSPTVFSDDVFDGYEEIFVVYCHLVMDKTLTASLKKKNIVKWGITDDLA